MDILINLPKVLVQCIHREYLSLRDFMNYGECSKAHNELFKELVDYRAMTLRYFPLYEAHPTDEEGFTWEKRLKKLCLQSIKKEVTKDEAFQMLDSKSEIAKMIRESIIVSPELADFLRLSHFGTNRVETKTIIFYCVTYAYVIGHDLKFDMGEISLPPYIRKVFADYLAENVEKPDRMNSKEIAIFTHRIHELGLDFNRGNGAYKVSDEHKKTVTEVFSLFMLSLMIHGRIFILKKDPSERNAQENVMWWTIGIDNAVESMGVEKDESMSKLLESEDIPFLESSMERMRTKAAKLWQESGFPLNYLPDSE